VIPLEQEINKIAAKINRQGRINFFMRLVYGSEIVVLSER
jgi:hypothetical protein